MTENKKTGPGAIPVRFANIVPMLFREKIARGWNLPLNIWVLTATSFLTDVSSEMIFNLVPLYLFNVLGVSTAIIGMIDGIAETTASLLKLYSGALSDKLGQRKWLAVIGYGISTISKPFLYFANNWALVLGVRFADRTGKGIRTAPRDALMAGSIDEKQRGLAFGVHRAGDTAGAFIGLGVTALIIWLTQSGATLTLHTFQIVVLASFIPALAAVIVLAGFTREVTVKTGARLPIFSMQGLDNRFKAFLLAAILFTLGNSSDSFIILRGQERGLSLLQIMLMLMTFNLVYSVLAGPFGALSDRFGRRRLILAGWMAYGLVYIGFAMADTGVQIWVLFGVYGLYYALTEGAAKAFVADLVPPERRGTAYGLYNAAIALTAFPASLIAGFLWQGVGSWNGFGPRAPFIFGAILALLAAGLFLTIKFNQNFKKPETV